MITRRHCLGWLLTPGLLSAQENQTSIQVTGAVKQPLTIAADNLAKMPRASVYKTSSGMETLYEGVWVHEILKKAGAPQGSALRGKALAGYVLAESQDGYQVFFSLAALDPAFIDNEILYLRTRLMASPCSVRRRDSRWLYTRTSTGARSVRMLTKLEVVQLRK